MSTDHVDNASLIHLSTTELIDLYNSRHEAAELVRSILISRAHFYEQTQQQNDKITRLLHASHRWIGVPVIADDLDGASEIKVLQNRIREALDEHERLHGQRG